MNVATSGSIIRPTGYTTYHCICSELIIALPRALQDCPKRLQDGAHICELDGTPASIVMGTMVDPDAVILKLDDGFEKRYLVKCSRCGVMVGYQLDQAQYANSKDVYGRLESALFLLAGGLVSTADLEAGNHLGRSSQVTESVTA